MRRRGVGSVGSVRTWKTHLHFLIMCETVCSEVTCTATLFSLQLQ